MIVMIIFDEEKWILGLEECGKYHTYRINTIVRYGVAHNLSYEELCEKFKHLEFYEGEFEQLANPTNNLRPIRTSEDCHAVVYKEELEWIMNVTQTHEQARILYIYLVLQKVFGYLWVYEQTKADICKLAKLKLTKAEYEDLIQSICCMDIRGNERDSTMPLYQYGIRWEKQVEVIDEWDMKTYQTIKGKDKKMHINIEVEKGDIAFMLDGEEELLNMIEPFLELYPAQKTYIKCEVCGNEFEQVDKRVKYCSDLCSTKAKSEKAKLRKRKQRAKH